MECHTPLPRTLLLSTIPASSLTALPSALQHMLAVRSLAWTWRMPSATCRCRCTTGALTSQCGAATSTSILGLGASPASSCTTATRQRGSVSGHLMRDGGDTSEAAVLQWAPALFHSKAPPNCSCPTHQCSKRQLCGASRAGRTPVGAGRSPPRPCACSAAHSVA